MMKKNKNNPNILRTESSQENSNTSRRSFLGTLGLGVASLSLAQIGCSAQKKTGSSQPVGADGKVIAGFDEIGEETKDIHANWVAVSDRKVKVGLVGYGLCEFAAEFGFQDHPNVEVVAVSDLFPDRCAKLAERARCNKKYPSLEEMVKDDSIEAIYIATDPPNHAKHAILALNHGKHVAVAVPAIFGSLEEADELYNAVKRSGKKYMMFETSCFREDLYAMKQIYNAGGFGKVLYSEGEYIHYLDKPLPSYKGWRDGAPPMFYLTHATAYYVGVTGGYFTEVSCYGEKSNRNDLTKGGKNKYNNSYATQAGMFKCDNGSFSRMMFSRDIAGLGAEVGKIRGELGSYERGKGYGGLRKSQLPNTKRPPLPPGMRPGGHGGSHGHLTEEFIRAILEDRQPLVNIAQALNMSIPGIIGHQSCLKGGETLQIPHYTMWV